MNKIMDLYEVLDAAKHRRHAVNAALNLLRTAETTLEAMACNEDKLAGKAVAKRLRMYLAGQLDIAHAVVCENLNQISGGAR